MPRYEETDFAPDIELMVAVSNWCLAPSRQGWDRVRAALPATAGMAQLAAVRQAIDAVARACDGGTLSGLSAASRIAAEQARGTLSDLVARAAHDKRMAANGIRPSVKATARPAMPAEEIPEDAPGLWWKR